MGNPILMRMAAEHWTASRARLVASKAIQSSLSWDRLAPQVQDQLASDMKPVALLMLEEMGRLASPGQQVRLLEIYREMVGNP
jgi:hypothetical protein